MAIQINLSGQEGNAYVLLGYALRLSKQLELDPKPIVDDMTSSDYNHLLNVFEKHFGLFVKLLNRDGEG